MSVATQDHAIVDLEKALGFQSSKCAQSVFSSTGWLEAQDDKFGIGSCSPFGDAGATTYPTA
jgi:hypothetical protein